MGNKPPDKPSDDGEWVYCRWITHWRTGKRIYPKRGTFFRFPKREKQ